MSKVHFFQHFRESGAGKAPVGHSDSIPRSVVCSALCQGSRLLVFQAKSIQPLIGGAHRNVELDGERIESSGPR
jgi:hypothetical protein